MKKQNPFAVAANFIVHDDLIAIQPSEPTKAKEEKKDEIVNFFDF